MGWTYFRDDRPTLDILKQEFQQAYIPGEKDGWEILDSSLRGRVAYLVMRVTVADGVKKHFAAIVLTSRKGNGDFGYKDMDESMLPYYYEAPLRMIDFLDKKAPAPEGSNAHQWRGRVRAWHNKGRYASSLMEGQIVEFDPPIKFLPFTEARFRVEKKRRMVRFVSLSTGVLCHITGWRNRNFVAEPLPEMRAVAGDYKKERAAER